MFGIKKLVSLKQATFELKKYVIILKTIKTKAIINLALVINKSKQSNYIKNNKKVRNYSKSGNNISFNKLIFLYAYKAVFSGFKVRETRMASQTPITGIKKTKNKK